MLPKILLSSVLVLLDFNLNSNLMQFYYAGVFALFLAGARREVCIERKLIELYSLYFK